jgi:hypothetical protein
MLRGMSTREELAEAISKSAGKGKWKYKGKVGVWRTTGAGDRIFIPDGGGKPMAMNKHTTAKAGGGKTRSLLKRMIGGAKKMAKSAKKQLKKMF